MLNNLKYWLGTFLFKTNASWVANASANGSYANALTDIEGNSVTSFNKNYNYINGMGVLGVPVTNYDVGTTLVVGAGGDVATTDGTFKLTNQITTGINISKITSEINFVDGKVRLLINATCTNTTTDTTFNISEIGIVLKTQFYSSSSTDTKRDILLDRKSVADGNFTPTTLNAGESKVFVYALEI